MTAFLIVMLILLAACLTGIEVIGWRQRRALMSHLADMRKRLEELP